MATTVVGLFDDRDTAQMAVKDLIDSGFDRRRISVVASDPNGDLKRQHMDNEGNLAGEGAATGLTSGAVVGGLLGLLIGAGAIFVPAGVLAAGPIAGLIAGGAAGAATGGILGGLIGLGIPKEDADVYAESVRRGGTLVMVQCEDAEVDRAHRVLDRDGAVDIDDRAAQYRSEGWQGYDDRAPMYDETEVTTERTRYQAGRTDMSHERFNLEPPIQRPTGTTEPMANVGDRTADNHIEVAREDLHVGKREMDRGVRVRKYVEERPVSEQVTLRDEQVHVNRRPVDRPVGATDAFREDSVEVHAKSEEAMVTKEARVVEEIDVSKTGRDRVETVRDTVREEHVEIEPLEGGRTGRGTAYADNPDRVDRVDETRDTRSLSEKIADGLTGDKTDDKTGRRVD